MTLDEKVVELVDLPHSVGRYLNYHEKSKKTSAASSSIIWMNEHFQHGST